MTTPTRPELPIPPDVDAYIQAQLPSFRALTGVKEGSFIEASVETLLANACKAFRNLESLIPPGGWLPIETAPKDGTVVMLWACNRDGVPKYWHVYFGEWFSDDWWTRDDLDIGYDGYGCRLYISPTHWMPLPTPPKASHEQS